MELMTYGLFMKKHIYGGSHLQSILSPGYPWQIGLTVHIFDTVFQEQSRFAPFLSQTLDSGLKKNFFAWYMNI